MKELDRTPVRRTLVAVQLHPRDAIRATPTSSARFADAVAPHLDAVAAAAQRFAPGADWEDVAQEGLFAAWRHRDSFDPDRGSLRAWLVTIVLNEARRTHRRRAVQGRLVAALSRGRVQDVVASPSGSAREGSARLDAVEDAVRSLPRRQREVVVLHYFVDLSVDDVAAVLGLAPGSVKSALYDARSRLRTTLDAVEEDHRGR